MLEFGIDLHIECLDYHFDEQIHRTTRCHCSSLEDSDYQTVGLSKLMNDLEVS